MSLDNETGLDRSFFSLHGPMDTMSWFSDHGVELKVVLRTVSLWYLSLLFFVIYSFFGSRLRMMEGFFLSVTVLLQ